MPDKDDFDPRDSILFNDNAFDRENAIGLLNTLEKQRFVRLNEDANDLFQSLVGDLPATTTRDEAATILNERFGEVIDALPEAWTENVQAFAELIAEPEPEDDTSEEALLDLLITYKLEQAADAVAMFANGLNHALRATSDTPAAEYYGEVDPSELTVGDADYIL